MSDNGPGNPESAPTMAPDASGNGNPAPTDSSRAGPPSPEYATVACPSCGKSVRIERRKLRPGRFKIRCGACRQPFALGVSDRLDLHPAALPPRHDDELPPALAATLGMTGGSSLRPGSSRGSGRSSRAAPATLAPDESLAGLSGSHAAISPDDSIGATAAPRSAGPDAFVAPPSQAGASLPPPEANPGDRLGGYELQKKLGEGGMGAVYLARQLSLDRSVALKVLSPKLSSLPALVGRFMREAYAAGQLVHHNVVQIYDFGKDKPRRSRQAGAAGGAPAEPGEPIHFFSMEFVDGSSLQNLVRERGRLEPKEAVSLILQAARGLAFAHEHGIIHRDIKPDNLMLNRLGVLKVADLGLVRQIGAPEAAAREPASREGDAATVNPPESGSISAAASAQITQVSQMMGTPAYMPPEQAADAKSADARADIYSLGCTLYHLVVGRPPFGGRTLQEVLDAHRFQKVSFPDPAEGGPKLSSRLKEIIRRMCGKDPQERYRSMERVVQELEAYLAQKHHVVAEPDEQQQKTLHWAAQQFNASTWFNARPLIMAGFVMAVLVAMAIVGATVPDPLLSFGIIGGLLGMCVLTFVFGFIWAGAKRRDVLFVKARQLVFGASLVDWLVAAVAVALVVTALVSFRWHFWWLGSGVLALGFAWLWQAIVDRGIQRDQQPMVLRSERVLREMRESGIDEARIRATVAEAAGRHWEGFYEALFGYEAKLDARRSFGIDEQGREKPRYAAWRDPILSWLSDRLEKRRMKRDRELLKSLHKNELLAQGIKPEVAEKQAGNQALRDVGKAAMLREQILAELRRELRREAQRAEEPPEEKQQQEEAEEEQAGEEKDARLKRRKIKYTDDDFERIHESYFKRRFGTPLDLILGQQVRFAVAAVLIVCFALWFNQNQQEIFIGSQAGEPVAAEADHERRVAFHSGGEGARTVVADSWWQRITSATQPLELPGLSEDAARWLSGFHVGLAGMLLAMSAFFYGRALGIVSLLAAALVVATPQVLPDWWWAGILLGVGLWAAAIFFLRVAEE